MNTSRTGSGALLASGAGGSAVARACYRPLDHLRLLMGGIAGPAGSLRTGIVTALLAVLAAHAAHADESCFRTEQQTRLEDGTLSTQTLISCQDESGQWTTVQEPGSQESRKQPRRGGLPLGVEVYDVGNKVFVQDVQPGGIAAVNGVLPTDQILEIDGTRVRTVSEMRKVLRDSSEVPAGVLTLLREGRLRTVRLERSGTGAAPPHSGKGDATSVVGCIRSPTIECLDAHILRQITAFPATDRVMWETSATSAFLRAGEMDRARRYLAGAQTSFLADEEARHWLNLALLAKGYGLTRMPLPSAIATEAKAIARPKAWMGIHIVRSLREAGFTALAEEILQDLHAVQVAKDDELELLSKYSYSPIAREYALLGKMDAANACVSDPRFEWRERIELRMSLVNALMEASRGSSAAEQLKAAAGILAENSSSMLEHDADFMWQFAIAHWQLGDVQGAKEQAGTLLRMISWIQENQGSHSPEVVEPLGGVLGLLGRHDEALALIEAHHGSATNLRRAKAYGKLAEGINLRHSSPVHAQAREPALQPVVRRALDAWKREFGSGKHWYSIYVADIELLFKLWASSSEPLPLSEATWKAGPAITEAHLDSARKSLLTGALGGFVEAERMADARKWALELKALMSDSTKRDLVASALVDGDVQGAIRLGRELELQSAEADVAVMQSDSLALAGDFAALARVYESASSTGGRLNVLLSLPIQVTGRCTTCVD